MTTTNPSVKGARNERRLAHELSLWYFRDPKVLIRRPGGGMVPAPDPTWVHLDDVWQIAQHDDPFPFCVQLKHHRDPCEVQHLFQPASKVRRAWEQCLEFVGERVDLWALLVYRTNRRPPFAVLHEAVAQHAHLAGMPAILFTGSDDRVARVMPFDALVQRDPLDVRAAYLRFCDNLSQQLDSRA